VAGQRCVIAGYGRSNPSRQGVFEDLAALTQENLDCF
jgi:hypothetical protein